VAAVIAEAAVSNFSFLLSCDDNTVAHHSFAVEDGSQLRQFLSLELLETEMHAKRYGVCRTPQHLTLVF
jgi:hypothetical protein